MTYFCVKVNVLLEIQQVDYTIACIMTCFCVNKRVTIGAPGPEAMTKVIEIYKNYLKQKYTIDKERCLWATLLIKLNNDELFILIYFQAQLRKIKL